MKILKFYTPTCVPCRALGKILEKVDWYNICTTPTLIFLNEKDEEVARTVGMKTQSQIEEIIKNNT